MTTRTVTKDAASASSNSPSAPLRLVENALQQLSVRDIVKLDDDRRAAMVSNLLVVLCADRDAQPVVNAGTIYQ